MLNCLPSKKTDCSWKMHSVYPVAFRTPRPNHLIPQVFPKGTHPVSEVQQAHPGCRQSGPGDSVFINRAWLMWVSRPHPLGQDTGSRSLAPGSAAASLGDLKLVQWKCSLDWSTGPLDHQVWGGGPAPPPGTVMPLQAWELLLQWKKLERAIKAF